MRGMSTTTRKVRRLAPAPRRRPRTLAEAIVKARLERDMSQADLAQELSTTELNIRRWESGRTKPSLPMYARMCMLFGWELPYAASSRKSATPDKLGDAVQAMLDATPDLAAVGG